MTSPRPKRARPQPTSDEAKGQRHEMKAAAGAPAQREESVHERLYPEVGAARCNEARMRDNAITNFSVISRLSLVIKQKLVID